MYLRQIIYMVLIILISSCNQQVQKNDPATVVQLPQQETPQIKQDSSSRYTGMVKLDLKQNEDPKAKEIRHLMDIPDTISYKQNTVNQPALSYQQSIEDRELPNLEPAKEINDDHLVVVSFDNDIFNNTDRYYTNGVRFEFISPWMAKSPFMKLMIPYFGNKEEFYGLAFGQNMYTPTNPDPGELLVGDRPFAAYLYLSHFKVTNDNIRKIRLRTDFTLGFLGQNSLGKEVQDLIHDVEPQGWKYQIDNDFMVDYRIHYEKGIFTSQYAEFMISGNARFGTIYNHLGAGVRARFGFMNPYFNSFPYLVNSSIKNKTPRKIQTFIYVTFQPRYNFYNATLQGGLINKNSIYTLHSNDINQYTYQATLGIVFSMPTFSVEVEQFLQSPEFQNALWHRWWHINLVYKL